MFETVSDFSDGLLLEIASTCAGAGAQLVLVNQILSRLSFRILVLKPLLAAHCEFPLGDCGWFLGKQECFGGTAE